MRPPPVVKRISPAEGPPETKVIIRGEHLGVNAKDVIDPLKESAVWLEEMDPDELRARSGSVTPVSPQINTSNDPLGTGVDVFSYKFTEEQLEDIYPEGSGNLLRENFLPGWFLLEKHSDSELSI
ncbi:exocyst complex component 2-like [Acropora millepora]|uniref:exocyst complex component 2-like n=1 Tax=Acropora millepora TaxID=45264 RepID=UPI001CF272F9|nr:exocyst complex component 2-like [Acropora millepora]